MEELGEIEIVISKMLEFCANELKNGNTVFKVRIVKNDKKELEGVYSYGD